MSTVTTFPGFTKSKPLILLLKSSWHQLFSKIKVSFLMMIAFFIIPKTLFHITRLGCLLTTDGSNTTHYHFLGLKVSGVMSESISGKFNSRSYLGSVLLTGPKDENC